MENVTLNHDGFPVDENGNFVHVIDENGNCVISIENCVHEIDENGNCGIRIVNREEIIFCGTDKQQVKQAIRKIANIWAVYFSCNLEDESIISGSGNEFCTVNPTKLPTVGTYIENLDNALNYFGNVYGINFEYLVYTEFKDLTNRPLIAAKTKLYNDHAIEKSVSFIENWFSGKDKIYLQKLELINKLEKESEPIKPRGNRKPEQIKFDGFFDLNKIDESKISEIKECFKDDTEKNFASLVELLKNQYQLIEIIPSSKIKGLKNFYRAIGGNEEKYESVRKCFDEKNEFKYVKKDPSLLSINERLKKIIE